MGCCFAVFAGFFPRIALVVLWLFTNLVDRAFTAFIWPLLGLLFLPFTTLMYVILYTPGRGVTGWEWFLIALAVVLDLGSYGGSGYGNRRRWG